MRSCNLIFVLLLVLFMSFTSGLSGRSRQPSKQSSWTTSRFSDELKTSSPLNPKMPAHDDELGEQPGLFRSGFVTIVGNPNVGKSSLMNAILGQDLSIVSPKPQTTRHRILGVVTNSSYQLVFSDTPGMLEPAYKLQEAMMESVRVAAGDADVVCLVSDVYGDPLTDDKVMQKLLVTGRPVVVVVNKIDLFAGRDDEQGSARWGEAINGSSSVVEDKTWPLPTGRRLLLRRGSKLEPSAKNRTSLDERLQPRSVSQIVAHWARRLPRAHVVCVSAQNRWGIDSLLALLVSLVPQGPKYFPSDVLTNRDERFFASEIIRESLLLCYQDEIPYSCEVVIDTFRDRQNLNNSTAGITHIEASVVASRASHKAILIGRAGSKLKELGSSARLRLENFLGRKVFLSLRVRIDEDWRGSNEALIKFGYVGDDYG